MSHWTTSGGNRLKAKQKASFAQRAQMRASVVAPQSVMVPSRQIPNVSRQQNANLNHRSISGLRRRYSFGNPIGRKGVVVPISAHNEQTDLVSPRIPGQYGLSSRRIRDPSAVRYYQSRTSPRVQHWMLEHGANASVRHEHHTPSTARHFPHPIGPRLLSHFQEESDAYHQFSPQRDTDFPGSSISSMRGTVDLSPMQYRHLDIPVGIPRFQKKPMEDTFGDHWELEWNTTSHPDDQTTFLVESSFPIIQETDSFVGQSSYKVPFHQAPQQSYNAPQWSLPFSRLDDSSLLHQRTTNNRCGLVSTLNPAHNPGVYRYGSVHPSALIDQEISIPYDMNGDYQVEDRHKGGFTRFRQPLKESGCSESYFAAAPCIVQQVEDFSSLPRRPYPTRPKPIAQPPLRFFDNGTEIDIDGMPLTRTWSSLRDDSRSEVADRQENHVKGQEVQASKDELDDFFDKSVGGIALFTAKK